MDLLLVQAIHKQFSLTSCKKYFLFFQIFFQIITFKIHWSFFCCMVIIINHHFRSNPNINNTTQKKCFKWIWWGIQSNISPGFTASITHSALISFSSMTLSQVSFSASSSESDFFCYPHSHLSHWNGPDYSRLFLNHSLFWWFSILCHWNINEVLPFLSKSLCS